MAQKIARRTAPAARPAFTHDCEECRFVGTLDGQDLFICGSGEYTRRFGNAPHECGSLGRIAPEGSAYSLIRALVERKLPPAAYVTVTR